MEKEEILLEYKAWLEDNRPFLEPWNVCEIPIIKDPQVYKDYFVPVLIKRGGIPKKDLEDGCVYIGKHRNCTEATWNKDLNKFVYVRYKFGSTFLDNCNHFEDDDGFALFVPIKLGTQEDWDNRLK